MRESSPAFLKALLQSERLRLRILIAAIIAAFAIRSLRTLLLFSRESLYTWLISTLFLAVFVGYELLMLRAVNRSLENGRDLPHAAWTANIVVETCLPWPWSSFPVGP